MSQLITEKENERFAANTADMTQDDFFVIVFLEMCTDPELSKRFREVKTNELTWEKLRDVAETYERATVFDARAMMVNSNRSVRVWRASASASAHSRSYMSMHADPS